MLQGPLRSTSARRLILAAAVGGCVLRLAFGLVYWNGKPLTHDEREYLALAANISAGRGFVYDPAARVRHRAAVRPRARLSVVSRSDRGWPH